MEVARQKYNTVPLSRTVRKYSQAGVNRKRKLDATPAASAAGAAGAASRLHDFVTKLNKRKKVNPQEALVRHQQLTRAAARKQQMLASGGAAAAAAASAATAPDAPASTDVSRLARAIQRRPDVNDMTPHTVEEYILETAERGAQRVYHTRLTIFQRLANEEYLGELYVERDYRESENKGSTCRFTLGTRPHALRYINQFTEIFTEEGRKSVKITHRVPNQQPRVTYTPGMRERMNEREQQQQQQRAAAAAAAAQQAAAQQAAVLAAAAQRGSPAAGAVPTTGVQQQQPPPTPPVVAAALAAAQQQQQQAQQQAQPQQTVLQKKIVVSTAIAGTVTTAPILQQQLSAPPNGPVAASPAATAAAAAHLPQHPLPLRATSVPVAAATAAATSAAAAPQTQQQPQPPPPNVLQGQLAIQTNAATPLLPVTPLAPAALQQTSPAAAVTPVSVISASATPSPLQQRTPTTNPPTPQPSNSAGAAAGGGEGAGDQQEKAISAIMQSLMQDSAKFDPDANKPGQQQSQQQQQPLASPIGAGAPLVQQSPLLTPAQLPTRPVPQASLGGAVKTQTQQQQLPQQQQQAANAKLSLSRVSLQNLLTAQATGQQVQQQQQPQVAIVATSSGLTTCAITSTSMAKVSVNAAMPQLAAQLSRPVTLPPPSYSQAVASQAQQSQAKQVGSTFVLPTKVQI